MRWKKRGIVFAIDLILCVQSMWIAYSLRMGWWSVWEPAIARLLPGALLLMVAIFSWCGVYSTIFRFAGRGMMITLVRAFGFYLLAMVLLYGSGLIDGVPRTVSVLQPILLFVLVCGSRLTIRYLLIELPGRKRSLGAELRRVLIYGAGHAGQELANSLRCDPLVEVFGYLDDDRRLRNQRLDGLCVFWSGDMDSVIADRRITDVLLALPRVNFARRQRIIAELAGHDVRIKTLPQLRDIVSGRYAITDVRPLDIDDLLGREPVPANELLLGRTVVNKTVLVSGAGGSIGSELCRQIIRIGAARIVLYEISEYGLYLIDGELRKMAASRATRPVEIVPVLGSVTDRARLEETFDRYGIDTVFHAAAYKHVPLVEENPIEAIRNNILGTYEIIDAAHRARVDDFVLVSTDKAVRPTNVMGATKRGAEQILQAYAERSVHTRSAMVRFGNVLGSSGSVVPLFRRQIEEGGPITLTHRDVARYFMSIPEAANLVIQAAGMAKGGEVYVLDMGRPVKIIDLARSMIRLSGLSECDDMRPGGDIRIVEVGLRPGEKLHEELLIGKSAGPTKHPQIMQAQESHLDWVTLATLLDRLRVSRCEAEAIALLRDMVPDFHHRRDNIPMRNAS